jgi:hypothetical protein
MKAVGKAAPMEEPNIGKIDILMWTKNAGKIFPLVLSRIEEVIPKDYICHKMIIDDSSTDTSAEEIRNNDATCNRSLNIRI